MGTHRRYTARMGRIRTLLVAVTCLVCVAAQAQWQWLDKDGHKVFSDRAPPPDVPAKNILKQPGATSRGIDALANAAPLRSASAPGPAGAEPPPGVDTPKLSGVDKELADKKKQAEAAAALKARAEVERVAKANTDNCELARSNKALMESGARVSQANAQGERVVLDDTARSAEIRRAQVTIDASCK